MAEDADYLYALEMQQRWNAENSVDESSSSEPEIVSFKMPPPSKQPLKIKRSNPRSNLDEDYLNRTQNLVHPQWEVLDPTPDVFSLFGAFDEKFFQGRLKCVTLEWSKRMYSCAGICYSRRNRLGMEITIRLSEPLLKLRPRKDLIETMLHEMIHAYCFVLNIREGNGGHGPNFKKIMYGINKVAGTNITVYHTFHDEVDIYKQHWWRCNGSCQNRAPFWGYVKRTSNRAPGSNDQWWAAHQESCGGTFMKIKEPEKPKKQKSVKPAAGGDLRKFFPTTTNKKANASPNNNFGAKINSLSNVHNSGSSLKGPIKTNGGGTMLLNPKTKPPSTKTQPTTRSTQPSIATAFPPTSYPGLSSDPFNVGQTKKPSFSSTPIKTRPAAGNLRNVVGFGDLGSTAGGRIRSSGFSASMANFTGSGSQLGTNAGPKIVKTSGSDCEIDRNHLRNLWSKRFGGGNDDGKDGNGKSKRDGIDDDSLSSESFKQVRPFYGDREAPTGDIKRRRISNEGTNTNGETVYVVDESNSKDWVVLDDEIMLREQTAETIAILSDDDDDDSTDNVDQAAAGSSTTTRSKPTKPLTTDERQKTIKQEILDDTIDIRDEDIILIDDEYNDDYVDDLNLSVAAELADNSVIDEFFGEDTLMKDFKRENAVLPSGSRYTPNPADDIITCPICQGKMKRSVFSEHLDGCTGIAIKIAPPKHALKKLSSMSREVKPRKARPPRKNAKDILRQAGYSEQDLANITSASSTDDEDLSVSTGMTNSSPHRPLANSTVSEWSAEDENTRRYRQRNLFKTTIQCPKCAQEVEQDEINDHLDDCLMK